MRSKHPRLPWHDVGMKIIGGSVSDIVKHFVEYWNFASYESLYQ
jgi:phospholipase D1/2